MPKYITVKYYPRVNLQESLIKQQKILLATTCLQQKLRLFLPKSVGTLSLDLRLAVPTGFYGKLFPRSGILREHFVTIDAGVVDADFRGIIQVLILNHHPEKTFTVRTDDRIAQVVFMEKFNANFHRVSHPQLLGKTKRGNDSFWVDRR